MARGNLSRLGHTDTAQMWGSDIILYGGTASLCDLPVTEEKAYQYSFSTCEK